ncbi:F0F1 ATP synthase subunit A [Thermoflavimicrobium dichotomicum]|uniref:ATP synthase subunit a n=1 Tax=Thermoflavimicrobium dichotomicum TaxID=46223 RepID=A0A1I3K2I0_9BACL|nr:F0F1 ATP synthase subunit A [Thermoflavimicrobium dichotomicum]SFI66624.1 F-type H+-transporting ATPase subunit a [Thermoflavimicrobium dichotomicum]
MEITPKLELFGLTFDVTVIIGSLLAAIIVFVITIMATRRLAMKPGKLQAGLEMLVDLARGMARMGHDHKNAERYIAFTFTLFLFILVANQIGVISLVTSDHHTEVPALQVTQETMKESNAHGVVWLKSPTADMNVTFSMAFAIAIVGAIIGISRNGLGKFLKVRYATPMGLLHLVEAISNPVTHAMRLWANIFAGEVLISILLQGITSGLAGLPLSIALMAWMGFSLFVGVMQAYIFTVLANVYMGQKIYLDHH